MPHVDNMDRHSLPPLSEAVCRVGHQSMTSAQGLGRLHIGGEAAGSKVKRHPIALVKPTKLDISQWCEPPSPQICV